MSKQEEEKEMVEELVGRRCNEGVWISSHLFLCFIGELSACALNGVIETKKTRRWNFAFEII